MIKFTSNIIVSLFELLDLYFNPNGRKRHFYLIGYQYINHSEEVDSLKYLYGNIVFSYGVRIEPVTKSDLEYFKSKAVDHVKSTHCQKGFLESNVLVTSVSYLGKMTEHNYHKG